MEDEVRNNVSEILTCVTEIRDLCRQIRDENRSTTESSAHDTFENGVIWAISEILKNLNVRGSTDICKTGESYEVLCEMASAMISKFFCTDIPDNPELSIEDLYECESSHVWVRMVDELDGSWVKNCFPAVLDTYDGDSVAVWSADPSCNLSFHDYGKTWKAYKYRPLKCGVELEDTCSTGGGKKVITNMEWVQSASAEELARFVLGDCTEDDWSRWEYGFEVSSTRYFSLPYDLQESTPLDTFVRWLLSEKSGE